VTVTNTKTVKETICPTQAEPSGAEPSDDEDCVTNTYTEYICSEDESSDTPSITQTESSSSIPSSVSACNIVESEIDQKTFDGRVAQYKIAPNTYTPAIDTWNTGAVTDMSNVFNSYTIANPDVACWDTKSATTMENMFQGTIQFEDRDISGWNVGRVSNMQNMFKGANKFNIDLSSWSTGEVTTTAGMFSGAHNFNADVPAFSSKLTDTSSMFNDAKMFNQPTNHIDTSGVTSMEFMFNDASKYNSPLFSSIGLVQDFNSVFRNAVEFNQMLDGWKVTVATKLQSMFEGAVKFNQDIPSWDIGNCTDCTNMFKDAISFNGDITTWTITATKNYQYQDLTSMFENATMFNQDIIADGTYWRTQRFGKTASMFKDAISLNPDNGLSTFLLFRVTDMSRMFEGASLFNGDITEWNTRDLLNSANMFKDATEFNQNIGQPKKNIWKMQQVTDMSGMFQGATKFNQSLDKWAVDTANNMSNMFNGATNFNQMLCSWKKHKSFPTRAGMDITDMFKDSNCDDKNEPTVDAICQSCT